MMKQHKTGILLLRICCFAAGAGFLCAGYLRGEVQTIMNKAVRICLECIGIG